MWWILGIIIYLIIGKVITNILFDNYLIDNAFEDISWIVAMLFPIILVLLFLGWIARKISNLFY